MNKEFFKRWSEAGDYHHVETRFCAKPMDKRDASPFVKLLVDKKLVLKGMIISIHGLEFKDDIFPR